MDTQRPNHLGGFLDFIERPQLGQQVGLKPRAVSESSSESSRLQRHTFEIRVAVRGCSASRTSRRRGSIHSTVDRRCVGLRGTWRERHRRGGVDVAAKAMRKMKCPVYQVLVMGRSCCSRMTPSHVQHAFWHQRSRNASEKIRGLATERWRFGVRRGLVVSTIHHCNALNVTSHPVTSCWHTSKVSCCEMLVSWSLHSPATASKHQTLISSGSW